MADIQSMIGKEVEVIANGMKYAGVLIEVSDAEVHLKCPMQWISLPASSVSEVRPKGEGAGSLRKSDYADPTSQF
jgi:hypothetical protein